MRQLLIGVVASMFLLTVGAAAQDVGDRVQLVERAIGIPGHPDPGINAVTLRYPSGSVVEVIGKDAATGWFEVRDAIGNGSWITPRYIVSVITPTEVPSDLCYRVGAWNLEHFGFGKSRGFPENTMGGPTYAPRTAAEFASIAAAIRDDMDIKILALSEINGDGSGDEATSDELDSLVAQLGPTYAYTIGSSGGSQRVALIYDTRYAKPNVVTEIIVPPTKIGDKDIFDRDPLVGYFTFLHDGVEQNDLIVVALHLASGQFRTENHDAAMTRLLSELGTLRSNGTVPANESDVILTGDLNASMFDNKREQFFETLNQGDWDVLADAPYPATRLAGNPLEPKSQIDYMIATRVNGSKHGLVGEEINESAATVHQDLAGGEWVQYRQTFSDHFPVSVCVHVTTDND